MIEWGDLPLVGATAFVASLLGSVAGSGGTAVLMPVLVLYYGVRQAIPVLTIANLVSNLGRVWFNWRDINFKVVRWFVLGAIPLALGGAYLFTVTPPALLTRGLGAFLLLTVAWRRGVAWRARRRAGAAVTTQAGQPVRPGFSAPWFLPLGAAFGLLGGLLEGVGSLMAPFFLGYGLLRGAYIGTDALGSTAMQVAKLGWFGAADVLSARFVVAGLTLAPFMLAGAWAGKWVVDRVPDQWFVMIIEATLIVAGVGFLAGG